MRPKLRVYWRRMTKDGHKMPGTAIGVIEQAHRLNRGRPQTEEVWRCDTDTEDLHPGHRDGFGGKAEDDALACAWRKAKQLGLVPGFNTTPEVRYERTP